MNAAGRCLHFLITGYIHLVELQDLRLRFNFLPTLLLRIRAAKSSSNLKSFLKRPLRSPVAYISFSCDALTAAKASRISQNPGLD